mmetsp:Transcript_69676/g.157529  ORF Transcript_69676/g.157529 Transcript_69676/m.157529 type:complete len:202 (+) Transcript_69676:1114-1719(+)
MVANLRSLKEPGEARSAVCSSNLIFRSSRRFLSTSSPGEPTMRLSLVASTAPSTTGPGTEARSAFHRPWAFRTAAGSAFSLEPRGCTFRSSAVRAPEPSSSISSKRLCRASIASLSPIPDTTSMCRMNSYSVISPSPSSSMASSPSRLRSSSRSLASLSSPPPPNTASLTPPSWVETKTTAKGKNSRAKPRPPCVWGEMSP